MTDPQGQGDLGQTREVLDRYVRPRLNAHGGDVDVAENDDGSLQLQFVGACRGCVALPMTYFSVVKPALEQIASRDVDCNQLAVSGHAQRRLESLWSDTWVADDLDRRPTTTGAPHTEIERDGRRNDR